MFKKLLALAIAVIMLLSVVACTQTPETKKTVDTDPSGVKESTGDTSSSDGLPPHYKIGVIIWSVEDAVTSSVRRLLDHAAEALNCEIIYSTGQFDAEAQLKGVENLIAAGCDGVMVMPIVDAGIPKYFEACKKAGIPMVQFYRYIVDEANRAALESEPLYLGTSMPDDVKAGEKMVQLLKDAGVTKVGMIGSAPGNDATDARQKGFAQAFDAGAAEKITEYIIPLGSTAAQTWSEATNNFITAFPEMDGIVMSVGAAGGSEATIAAIEQSGAVGKVKLSLFDVPSNSTEAFEKGILCGVANGMHFDPMAAFILLVNKINGTPLSETAVKLDTDYIYITSYDEDVAYYKYIDSKEEGVYAFSTEEIQQMYRFYNPDFSLEDLQKVAASWNMEDLLDKLVK